MSTPTQRSPRPIPTAYTAQIESSLGAYCQGKIKDTEEIGSGATRLWQEIDRYIQGGGKRLRPRLFLMAYEYYGGSNPDAAIPAACAWELLHASLLIHDDIIDRDTVRHGKLNVAGEYKKIYSAQKTDDTDHYALSAALLAGDLLLSSAFDIVNRSELSDSQKIAMQRCLNDAIFAVGGGELIDTESALYPIDSVDPFKIATYKTASYSFELPMQSGALLAGASPEELDRLGEIARHAGIAFQLKDDLLGVYGDSTATGKSNRSDITEKKRTLLIQRALQHMPTDEKLRIKSLYNRESALTEEEAEEVFKLVSATPARDEIDTIIENSTAAALAAIQLLSISDDSKSSLSELIDSLVGRNH